MRRKEGKEVRRSDEAREQAKSHQSKSIVLQSKPVLWGQVPQGWQKWREEVRRVGHTVEPNTTWVELGKWNLIVFFSISAVRDYDYILWKSSY